ncbi:hypothetical protein ACJIZ3_016335 [Penstemon smallii]|uniref:Malic enzyme n=1 Tax=Penstemon smallii TaxID=265156 RepID=A0ABD3RQ34_9LAMI
MFFFYSHPCNVSYYVSCRNWKVVFYFINMFCFLVSYFMHTRVQFRLEFFFFFLYLSYSFVKVIVSVFLGYNLLRDPHHNKGIAFTEKERDAHYLRGLLPAVVISQELQEKKFMHNLRQYELPLHKYMAMMELDERNERLFYKLLIDNVDELLPIVYTPVVGEACQKYGSIFRRAQGLYISLKEKGKILEVLRNWSERSIQVIVVTDGERILGLGDLGCQGMGIPVGKLALYTALGGVRPSSCLPITIDVGTNNEKLLNDEFYIGLRQKRATGKEYYDFLNEFMCAAKQNYGEKVLYRSFEDFANHNAFELLAKYGTTHLVFNDDIHGTTAVVLVGLVASLKLLGGTLADHTFLFLGAGEAGTGIPELIALEMSKQTKIPLEETHKKIWLVDSKGLIVSSRKESLQHFKKPWAHEHEPVNNLLDAVKVIKPTTLIGTSGGRGGVKNLRQIFYSLKRKTKSIECRNYWDKRCSKAITLTSYPFVNRAISSHERINLLSSKTDGSFSTVKCHYFILIRAMESQVERLKRSQIFILSKYKPLTIIRDMSKEEDTFIMEDVINIPRRCRKTN